MGVTTIEWTSTIRPDGTSTPGYTFNPVRGCTKISPGCTNCYAETLSHRNPAVLGIWGDNGTRVVAAESAWKEPLKWDKAAAKAGERHRVFCASLADVFEDRPELDDPRARLWSLIAKTPNLDWLLLTKRPRNIRPLLERFHAETTEETAWEVLAEGWPSNIWLGTSVEDRKHGLPRIDVLRSLPCAARFLSVEPLLEDLGRIDLTGIDWVIVGGESGPNARTFDVRWARSIRDQCRASGVAFFMKQMGRIVMDSGGGEGTFSDEWPDGTSSTFFEGDDSHAVYLRDKKGGDWDEFPADLRMRQFPALEAANA